MGQAIKPVKDLREGDVVMLPSRVNGEVRPFRITSAPHRLPAAGETILALQCETETMYVCLPNGQEMPIVAPPANQ